MRLRSFMDYPCLGAESLLNRQTAGLSFADLMSRAMRPAAKIYPSAHAPATLPLLHLSR